MYVMSRPTLGSVDRSSNRAVGRGRSGVLARAPTTAVWGRSPPVPSAAATVAPALRSPHSLASPASWPCAAPHRRACACTARPAGASAPGSRRSLPPVCSTAPIARSPTAGIAAPGSEPLPPVRSIAVVPLTRKSGLFFEPVHFHLQFSDLLIQLGFPICAVLPSLSLHLPPLRGSDFTP